MTNKPTNLEMLEAWGKRGYSISDTTCPLCFSRTRMRTEHTQFHIERGDVKS
jgi:hypothetical protein